jgi:flagellar secretion chaperone FliS
MTTRSTSISFAQPRPADTGSASAYLRTKVLTASQEELRLMLLDGAIKFARQGMDGLERRDFEASFQGLSQCREIITELLTGMRPEVDPSLCSRIRSLYSFMFNELVEASLQKDPARVGKVIELLEYERETWSLLMQRVAQDRSNGTASPAAASERLPLSVQA